MELFWFGTAMMMVLWLRLKPYHLEIQIKLYRRDTMSVMCCQMIRGQEVKSNREETKSAMC